MTQIPIAKQKQEPKPQKFTGRKRWDISGGRRQIREQQLQEKKKKKADHMGKPPKPAKDRSKLRQAGHLIGVLQEVTFTKKAV